MGIYTGHSTYIYFFALSIIFLRGTERNDTSEARSISNNTHILVSEAIFQKKEPGLPGEMGQSIQKMSLKHLVVPEVKMYFKNYIHQWELCQRGTGAKMEELPIAKAGTI